MNWCCFLPLAAAVKPGFSFQDAAVPLTDTEAAALGSFVGH